MVTFSDKVLRFYRELKITGRLPRGIEVMNPYQNKDAYEACRAFYGRYYNDTHQRFLILGINPGRYGAGITGIPFTDPIKLEKIFGISNNLPRKPELSADFIHAMIGAFGGYDKFFRKFFINSVSPLGFTREGKNLNYYDTPALRKSVEPFIKSSLATMLTLGLDRSVVFCLGEGANYKYLKELNSAGGYFDTIITMAHPRFIMQYKRKHVQQYIDDYVKKLRGV